MKFISMKHFFMKCHRSFMIPRLVHQKKIDRINFYNLAYLFSMDSEFSGDFFDSKNTVSVFFSNLFMICTRLQLKLIDLLLIGFMYWPKKNKVDNPKWADMKRSIIKKEINSHKFYWNLRIQRIYHSGWKCDW